MKKAYLVFLFLAVFVIVKGQEEEEKNWELHGYVKNVQSIVSIKGNDSYLLDNLIHNRLNFKWYVNDNFTVHAGLRNRLFFGDTPRLTPNYAALIENGNNDALDLSVNIIDGKGVLLNSYFDRLYVDYAKGNWELRLGRQRINWGINTFWNPNDIFNAYSFTDFDYAERPGSDAIRIKYNLGFASSVELAIKYFDDWDEAVIGGLWKTNVKSYDIQFLAGKVKSDMVLGMGWAGNIKNAGFKGEVSWFSPINSDTSNSSVNATMGLEYAFKKGLFISGGFLYNSEGRTKGGLADVFNFELSAKNLYPFQYAIYGLAQFPLNPMISGGLSVVYSPVSSSPMFISPSIGYAIAQNWDLDLTGQLVYNQENKKYINPISAIFLRINYSF